MAENQAQGHRRTDQKNESAEDASAADAANAAETARQRSGEVTAAADELIDEIDEIILSTLVGDDEELSDDEVDQRAAEFVGNFQQRNGQ